MRAPLKNPAVEKAFRKYIEHEEQPVYEETPPPKAMQRVYLYVLALALIVLFYAAESLPWASWVEEARPVVLSWIDWVKSWL